MGKGEERLGFGGGCWLKGEGRSVAPVVVCMHSTCPRTEKRTNREVVVMGFGPKEEEMGQKGDFSQLRELGKREKDRKRKEEKKKERGKLQNKIRL